MTLTEANKRDLVRRAWTMQKTEQIPFLIEVGRPHRATSEFINNPVVDLEWQQDYCRRVAELDDYFIPNLKPNLGIGVIAASFGCRWTADLENDPWIKPIITSENIQDVYAIEMPDPAQSGLNALAFERLAYFQDHSDLPLRLVNVPSPLVTASLIWEYSSFLSGTMLQPKEVHTLLDMVTEATITFVKLQLEKIENLFAMTHEPWYLPADLGIRISDDTAQVMSPKTYREFGLPYNSRIAKAFNGVVIHSCGDITHVLPAMLEIPDLRGIDLVAPQNNWWKVREITREKTALCLRYFSWDFPNSEPWDLGQYSRSLVDFFGDKGVLLWSQTDTLDEAIELSQVLHTLP